MRHISSDWSGSRWCLCLWFYAILVLCDLHFLIPAAFPAAAPAAILALAGSEPGAPE